MRRRAILGATGAALAGLSGCLGTLGQAGADCGENCDVGMSTNAFLPDVYRMELGETVVWKNSSSRNHTVTAYEAGIPEGATYFASGGFESEPAAREGWQSGLEGAIRTGETYEYTPEVAGVYQYLCIPHETQGMVGQLEVVDPDATGTPTGTATGPGTTSG